MAAPKPPEQLRARRTRRHLLDAARAAFAERGYEGASIDDICRAAGLSKGAYYFHFRSKEQVLSTLIEEWTGSVGRLLDEAAGAPSAIEALRRAVEALFSYETDGGLLLEFWARGLRNRPLAGKLQRAERNWRETLVTVISRAQRSGLLPAGADPQELATALVTLTAGTATKGMTGKAARLTAQTLLDPGAGRRTLRRAG